MLSAETCGRQVGVAQDAGRLLDSRQRRAFLAQRVTQISDVQVFGMTQGCPVLRSARLTPRFVKHVQICEPKDLPNVARSCCETQFRRQS